MKTARQYIYALLFAALLVIQLAQAAHYRVHFQEPEYAGRLAQIAAEKTGDVQHKAPDHDGPDDCALCFFMKYLSLALLVTAISVAARRLWQPVAAALLRDWAGVANRAYSARASPAA